MKIQTRREREKKYKSLYGNISNDKITRLKNFLGNKFNIKLFTSVFERMDDAARNLKYYKIKIIFYEEPIQSHRPRTKGKNGMGMYVPNAKSNHDAIKEFVSKLNDNINIIATPMKIILNAYYPMPKKLNPLEVLMYELEHDYAIGKPDFDNVLKAYSDMLLKTIILDDDLVSSCSFNKYFSLKPRVELEIIYTNGFVSEYAYKTIKSRKSFQELKDNIDIKLLVTPYKILKIPYERRMKGRK